MGYHQQAADFMNEHSHFEGDFGRQVQTNHHLRELTNAAIASVNFTAPESGHGHGSQPPRGKGAGWSL